MKKILLFGLIIINLISCVSLNQNANNTISFFYFIEKDYYASINEGEYGYPYLRTKSSFSIGVQKKINAGISNYDVTILNKEFTIRKNDTIPEVIDLINTLESDGFVEKDSLEQTNSIEVNFQFEKGSQYPSVQIVNIELKNNNTIIDEKILYYEVEKIIESIFTKDFKIDVGLLPTRINEIVSMKVLPKALLYKKDLNLENEINLEKIVHLSSQITVLSKYDYQNNINKNTSKRIETIGKIKNGAYSINKDVYIKSIARYSLIDK